MNPKNKIRAVLVYERASSQTKSSILKEASLKKLSQAFGSAPVFSNFEHKEKQLQSIGSIKAQRLGQCLEALQAKTCKEEYDSIALCYGFYPLLDPALTQEALGDHQNYLAHFTYGENIPMGLLPDFVSKDFIEEFPNPKEDFPEDLRAFVLKNIEKYDVEIFYKNPDLRQYRLDFSSRTPRSQNLAEQILKRKPDLSFAQLSEFIKSKPEILRPYPSYFEIELSTNSPLRPFYFPKRESQKKTEFSGAQQFACSENMDLKLIQKLIEDVGKNGMREDASFALGGLGEPTEHPRFLEILSSLLKLKQTKRVYLETFGLGLDKDMLESLSSLEQAQKLHVIIRLNSLQKERYAQMYGADLLHKVHDNIKAIEQMSEKKRCFHVYAEMIRMQENDDEIDLYFARFENSAIKVILQKYNRYIDILPERRAVNLNPLHRSFCWHLARDFYLKVNGQSPLCKQDPFATRAPFLSFKENSVREILEKTMPYHKASVQGKHSELPISCLECDEWYTFNG